MNTVNNKVHKNDSSTLKPNTSKVKDNEARKLTEDSVGRVHRHLVLGGVTNETLRIGESNITGGSPVPLVVSDDLHTIMLPHADTTVCCAQVDADSRPFTLARHGNTQ
jgi:hypothetical protein